MNIPEAFIFSRLSRQDYLAGKQQRLSADELKASNHRYRMNLIDKSEEDYYGASLLAQLTGKIAVARFTVIKFMPVRISRYPWESDPYRVILDQDGMILKNRYRERGYFLPPEPEDIEFSEQIADQ